MDTVTDQQLEQFRRDGYMVIKSAFSKDIAAACENCVLQILEHEDNVNLSAPYKARFVLKRRENAVFDRMITPKLTGTLDKLFGTDGWDRAHFRSHGDFFVTFPGFVDSAEKALPLVGRWHVDVGYRAAQAHDISERNCAFVPAFLLTESKKDGACTLVSAGSHLLVARLLAASDDPVSRQDMVAFCEGYLASREGRASVVQLVGEAGDVVVLHPLLMHAASANCRDNVRIMANTGVGGNGKRQLSDDDAGRSVSEDIIWQEIRSIRREPRERPLLKLALSLNRYLWAIRYKLYDRWKREAETNLDRKTAASRWRTLSYVVLKPACSFTTSAILKMVG